MLILEKVFGTKQEALEMVDKLRKAGYEYRIDEQYVFDNGMLIAIRYELIKG